MGVDLRLFAGGVALWPDRGRLECSRGAPMVLIEAAPWRFDVITYLLTGASLRPLVPDDTCMASFMLLLWDGSCILIEFICSDTHN